MKFLKKVLEEDIGIEEDIEMTPDNKELLEYIQQTKARIVVVGCGGAGNNTITRLTTEGIEGATTIAINTDAQQLLRTKADKKILIGKKLTRGLGAGGDPKKGEEAAKENAEEIKAAIQDADMVFITCGLGGGTGTGSAPVVAEIAKKLGALTVAVVTLPFEMEGKVRMRNAMQGLEKLKERVDTLVVIPNEKLFDIVPHMPIKMAFKVADEVLINAVKGLVELITKDGLINVDFADVKAVMSNGGMAMIGIGESDGEKRAKEAINMALNSPLLDVDIDGAKGALIHVMGPEDMTLEESREVVSAVSSRLDPEATIIWGATIDDSLEDTLKVLLVVTGVQSRLEITPDGLKRKKKDELKKIKRII
ncbi:cell division protein FtsZ [Methanocaldococcus infernus ME]|uniref:Cell division protein FtsZ n=1 Tax=Methanocaldococcus infernus (strain DSM 11812 / JCM 15783 / ME) TaxID=573063 RepID=D5VTV7_METIM|nr:cell division protein FtsZ [Methanocaldococcus infernus]ADG14010.1 cell division protein FtsZ [Methanocaldococcus infernus ME]